jgi:hypothetical protein
MLALACSHKAVKCSQAKCSADLGTWVCLVVECQTQLRVPIDLCYFSFYEFAFPLHHNVKPALQTKQQPAYQWWDFPEPETNIETEFVSSKDQDTCVGGGAGIALPNGRPKMLIQQEIPNKRHYGTSLHCKIMHTFNKAIVYSMSLKIWITPPSMLNKITGQCKIHENQAQISNFKTIHEWG